MKKLILMAIFIACSAPFTFAQNDDYNKYDVYVGYSHERADTGINDADPDVDDIFDEREGLHGFEAAITGNVSRYVGLKGDYAFHRKSFDISDGVDTFQIDTDFHTLVGGVQFKDNARETKVKPFAHLMAGFTHARINVTPDVDISDNETGFSGIIGGGIDVRVSPRVDIRAIQFDYNPTHLADETQHNFRIGVGVVFR